MGIVTKPNTFTAGTTIVSTQVNSDFDTLYSLVNGLLDDANINPAAAINWSKLATVANRNIAFGTGYGISTDYTTSNNYIHQTNLALPAPMSGTGRMIQAYNTSLVAGVWAGRTVTDACTAIIETTANVLEYWYAPSAASPAVPAWTKVFAFNLSTGVIDTGILALASVSANAAAQLTQISSDFGFPSTGTNLPTGWAATYTNATDITYNDSLYGRTTLITANTGGRPPCIYRTERFNNASSAGQTFYFYTEAFVNVQAGLANNSLRVGWCDSSNFIGPNANGISVFFGTDLNLYLRVRQASVNFDTLLQAYAVGALYRILIVWTTQTSIAVYINGVLKATYVTTANFPSAVLFPVISGLTQDGSNSAGSWGFTRTAIGRG